MCLCVQACLGNTALHEAARGSALQLAKQIAQQQADRRQSDHHQLGQAEQAAVVTAELQRLTRVFGVLLASGADLQAVTVR